MNGWLGITQISSSYRLAYAYGMTGGLKKYAILHIKLRFLQFSQELTSPLNSTYLLYNEDLTHKNTACAAARPVLYSPRQWMDSFVSREPKIIYGRYSQSR